MIESFLRVENTPTEQGYNTSGGTPFDDKAGPWTDNLTLANLQGTEVTLNGISYFKLLLDINELGGKKSLISLDQLQLYTFPLWAARPRVPSAPSEPCATASLPGIALSSTLHAITAAAPATSMLIFRPQIFPGLKRTAYRWCCHCRWIRSDLQWSPNLRSRRRR